MVPKAWRIFKYKKLTTIQKFLRGYFVHKRVFTELNSIKLQSAFEYFDKVKAVLKENSQIKIRYYYFKWKRMMKIKEEEEAKNKSKKKGKKGSMLRKGNASFKNNIVNTPSMKKFPSKDGSDTVSSKSVVPNKIDKTIDPSSPMKKSQFFNNDPQSPVKIESVLEEDYEEDEELNKDII